MNHPPIPLNCDLFGQVDGYDVFFLNVLAAETEYVQMRRDFSKHDRLRSIISSIARCAWIDVFHQCDPHNIDYQNSQEFAHGGATSESSWHRFCKSNTEAWRVWGNS